MNLRYRLHLHPCDGGDHRDGHASVCCSTTRLIPDRCLHFCLPGQRQAVPAASFPRMRPRSRWRWLECSCRALCRDCLALCCQRHSLIACLSRAVGVVADRVWRAFALALVTCVHHAIHRDRLPCARSRHGCRGRFVVSAMIRHVHREPHAVHDEPGRVEQALARRLELLAGCQKGV